MGIAWISLRVDTGSAPSGLSIPIEDFARLVFHFVAVYSTPMAPREMASPAD